MITSAIYQFQGNPEDEGAWQAFVAANSISSTAEQERAPTPSITRIIYEVFTLVVVLGALAATMLWQKTEVRFTQLEAEIQSIQGKLSATDNQLVVEGGVAGVNTESTDRQTVHMLDTKYFRFAFTLDNTTAVAAIAFKIDSDYGQLCTDLAVDPLSGPDRFMIYVTGNSDGRRSNPYLLLEGITLDLSADRQLTTANVSDQTQLLYNDLFGQLARRTLDEALSNKAIKVKWNAVIDYLYHHLAQSQLPLPLEEMQSYELQRRQLAQKLSPAVAQLAYEPGNWMFPSYTLAYITADPLVEYILVTYGRESIPQLLDALSAYDDWDEIAPAVFSISADQFEAEWHAYLQQQYPIAPVNE